MGEVKGRASREIFQVISIRFTKASSDLAAIKQSNEEIKVFQLLSSTGRRH